ncbi:TMEM165/GDT1 family protein [Marinomonas sp. 15G1-11]|uniref:GDT1 family protein n=1 Tax=Marinomonas phaeophyticola TaxID=3004091 RepID=A0ABT4JUZ2_9GAMM|nr:TMEM165/GDT1 family protein [Marinomonas sp. 15G1-11]MCZ2722036.1 TMEM165/GDT1 family protein [Marinomonas sp. 15G1-11]
MEAILTSITSVAIAEIGDKTQLLALFLATKYRNKTAIILGIFVATVLNHGISAWLGNSISQFMSEFWLSILVGISFILLGLWLLIPDEDEQPSARFLKWGAFSATTFLFFLAEIGDKTQVATVLLGAHFDDTLAVVIGSTIGMMLANVPVVFAGQWLIARINPTIMHKWACALFILIGIITLCRPLLKG